MKKKQIIVISGLSGGGKTTAAHALEDIGFFVVDNLPVPLFGRFLRLAEHTHDKMTQIAWVIDAREPEFIKDFPKVVGQLKKTGHFVKIIYFEASDEILIRRYKETRRKHPTEGGEGIRAAIEQEKHILHDVRNLADEIINTEKLTVHDLRNRLKTEYSQEGRSDMHITFMSFGFKHGLPAELDMCFDVRFLRNPHFIDELRPLTGKDTPVSDYVLTSKEAKQFLKHVEKLLEFVFPAFQTEGKSYMTVGIGCTGGKHRSVAIAEELARRFTRTGAHLRIEHRDIAK